MIFPLVQVFTLMDEPEHSDERECIGCFEKEQELIKEEKNNEKNKCASSSKVVRSCTAARTAQDGKRSVQGSIPCLAHQ
jgi:uncharacterized protein with von Willebrand factor type A (vWA) domain